MNMHVEKREADLFWLKKLSFCKITFVLQATQPLLLPPYKGFTLRGAFGVQFKRVVCVNKGAVCQSCLLKGQCSYYRFFESPNFLSWHHSPHIPHPYVIEPPLEPKKTLYQPGETFQFDMILIGNTMELLPYVILVFWELGSRGGIGKNRPQGMGKYKLVRVLDALDGGKNIFTGESGLLHSMPVARQIAVGQTSFPSKEITVRIATPLRLKFEGHLTGKDGNCGEVLPSLFTGLFSRFNLLVSAYCDPDMGKQPVPYFPRCGFKSKLKWVDWSRYSTRQETSMEMGGLVGTLEVPEKYAPWWDLLKAGEILHVGKATSFGFGKYVLE